MLEESRYYFAKAASILDLNAKVKDILSTPKRVVKVEIVSESSNGDIHHHLGFHS